MANTSQNSHNAQWMLLDHLLFGNPKKQNNNLSPNPKQAMGKNYIAYNILLITITKQSVQYMQYFQRYFCHWNIEAYKCFNKVTEIGPDNGLLPGRLHVIIWTNVRILLIWTLGTNISEILAKFIHFH